MPEILEALMVISFGLSWPISIMKTLKAKSAKGKSPLFISLIVFGYICGIISKIIGEASLNYVFIFYCINLVMTTFDLFLNLYFRNVDKKKEIVC